MVKVSFFQRKEFILIPLINILISWWIILLIVHGIVEKIALFVDTQCAFVFPPLFLSRYVVI